MRLVRYSIYGMLLAFAMYVCGALYHHNTFDASLFNQSVVPLTVWGIIAGIVGGGIVTGIAVLINRLRKRPVSPWPWHHWLAFGTFFTAPLFFGNWLLAVLLHHFFVWPAALLLSCIGSTLYVSCVYLFTRTPTKPT